MSSERLHLYIVGLQILLFYREKEEGIAAKIPMVAVVVVICRREFMAKLEIDLCVICWPAAEIYKAKNICRLHYKFQDTNRHARAYSGAATAVQFN